MCARESVLMRQVSRVAQLEQKLDGIMSLLESGQRGKRRLCSAGSASTAGEGSSPLTPDSQGNNPWPFRRLPSDSAAASNAHSGTTAANTGGGGGDNNGEGLLGGAQTVHVDRGIAEMVELVPGLRMTFTEAAEHLHVYRKDYMPVFPFVVIEETTKPHELYYNAPALFWMIMAAVTQTSEEMDVAVKKWLRQHVAEKMVVKQEKSLQLLQAILVHLIWYVTRLLAPFQNVCEEKKMTCAKRRLSQGLLSLLH